MRVHGQLCWYGQGVQRPRMLGKAFDNENHIIKKWKDILHVSFLPVAWNGCHESVLRTCALLRYRAFSVFFFHRKMSANVHEQRRSYVWYNLRGDWFLFQLAWYRSHHHWEPQVLEDWFENPQQTTLVLAVAKVAPRGERSNSLSVWVTVVNSSLSWFVSQIFWIENNFYMYELPG